MKLNKPFLFVVVAVSLLMSGCAQKVRIKALSPAEVGEMAVKKKVAITDFKNDTVGLSGKIESKIASHKLDGKRYFTVLSRKDMSEVIAEQKLQSSELMDESTSSKVGKLIGAQAIISGEIASADAESDSYMEERERCLKYVKDGGCVKYRYYRVRCNTTQAQVSANISVVDVETGLIIYGDAISKEYSADSCKNSSTNFGLVVLNSTPKQILSKRQALNRLTSKIADEFIHKLTPHYVYFNVELLDSIKLDEATKRDKRNLEISLKYIKSGRMQKAEEILTSLMDSVDGKSFVVAYNLGVVKEALGKLDKAQNLYEMADELTPEPVDEINAALSRIDSLIDKNKEAKRQISAE